MHVKLIAFLLIVFFNFSEALCEEIQYDEIPTLFNDIQHLMEGPIQKCEYSGELQKYYETLSSSNKEKLTEALVKIQSLGRKTLLEDLKSVEDQFSEKNLKNVAEAKILLLKCSQDPAALKPEEDCNLAANILSEFEKKLAYIDNLQQEIELSNKNLITILNSLKTNSNIDGVKLSEKEMISNLLSEDPFASRINKKPVTTNDLTKKINQYFNSGLKDFIHESVQYYVDKDSFPSKGDDLSKAFQSVRNLSTSPLILQSSSDLNQRLITRTRDLIFTNKSGALFAPSYEIQDQALIQTNRSIQYEIETQAKNQTERAIQYLVDEEELENALSNTINFSIDKVRDSVFKDAWAKEFLKNYKANGVSKVPDKLGRNFQAFQKANRLRNDHSHFVESCNSNAQLVGEKGLKYLQSAKRQIEEVIKEIEFKNERTVSIEEFVGILAHKLPQVSQKIAKINRVSDKDNFFEKYLDQLNQKDSIDPSQELSVIFGLATDAVTKGRENFLKDCNAEAYFPNIEDEDDTWDPEIDQIIEDEACEFVAKELRWEGRKICPIDELVLTENECRYLEEFSGVDFNCTAKYGFFSDVKDWLKKRVKSFKDKVKEAYKDLSAEAKRAWKKTKKLAKNFVSIISQTVNGVYQLATKGKIDFDELKRHQGVSRWFNETVDKLDELREAITKKALSATKNYIDTTLSLGDATIHFIGGDKNKAKEALRRAKADAKDTIRDLGKAGEAAVKAYYTYTVEAPLELSLGTIDSTTGSDLKKKYQEKRDKFKGGLKETGGKVGAVLEVTIQPENIGKIAFVYAASTVAGPLGSSFASVMYDKLVTNKGMEKEDMLKSFTIGVAAGYAGEAVSGAETLKDSAYLARAAGSFASSTTADLGDAVLNDKSIRAKDLLINIGTAALSVDAGNGVGGKIFNDTVNGALSNTVEQTVESGFKLSQIDFEQVENAAIQGFANGITREAVHSFMDATIIKAIPEEYHRIDKATFAELKETMYQALTEMFDQKIQDLSDVLRNSNQTEKIELLIDLQEEERDLLKGKQNNLSEKLFGKPYTQLSEAEIKNPNFIKELLKYVTSDPDYLNVRNDITGVILDIAPKFAMHPATQTDPVGDPSLGIAAISTVALVSELLRKHGKNFLNLFKDSDETSDTAIEPTDAKDFEKDIKSLPPGERVAEVKGKAKEIAETKGFIKNKKLSKQNRRTIYTDEKGQHWSVDTEKGRFEKLNDRGEHQGEYDFDFNQTGKPDKTGKHNIKT